MGEKIFYLFFGWFLGIFSPLIVDKIQKHYQKKELKKGFFTELRGIRLRLVLLVYGICANSEGFNRELLTWTYNLLKEYVELKEYMGLVDSKVLEILEKQMKMSDEALDELAKMLKASKPEGMVLGLKKFALPFLDSQLGRLSLFNMEFQNQMIEVRVRLGLLNEDIELFRFYYEKTFDSALSEDNREIITFNIHRIFENMSRGIRRIVDNITKLMDSA